MQRRILPMVLCLLFLGACRDGDREAEIQREIAAANRCQTDADCVIVASQCPFDCYVLTRASEAQRIQSLIAGYHSTCTYSCVPAPPFACEGGECRFMRRDACASLAASLDEAVGVNELCADVTMENVATAEPLSVGGTLESVSKKNLTGARREYIEYVIALRGNEKREEFTLYSKDDIVLIKGGFYRFDVRNRCKYFLLQDSSPESSPVLDLFTLPEPMTCAENSQ